MHKGTILAKSVGKEVINCKTCGYSHVNPLPTQKELDDFYLKSFYQDVKTSYFDDYERDNDWWSLNYNWLLDDLLKILQLKTSVDKVRLLDIGSGPGLFLRCAKDIGINAIGIEPSLEAFKYSRKKHNVDVLNVTLENMDQTVEKFDIVHSSLVMEHILDPLQFIKKSKNMIKKGGLLCIIVPNDFNPIQKINVKLGSKQWWVSPFEHLNYFNRKSLRGLVEKAGLKVVHESVTFPIDLFLLFNKNYLDNPTLGQECHNMRKSFEFNLGKTNSDKFRKNLYKAFSKLGVGRELVIIARN
jgi:SAM-dependent methyltransferase